MSIKSATHSMNVIEEENGIALIEITKDDTDNQSDKRFYVVSVKGDQVFSAVPADCPDSGSWYGAMNVGGVAYVANGRTYPTARRWFNKLSAAEVE